MSNVEIVRRFCSASLPSALHIPAIRSKFYENSCKVFQTTHQKSSPPLYSIAKQYSSVLRDQIHQVEQFYGPIAAEERKTYQELERIWTLCQLLYFPVPEEQNNTQPFMDWFNTSFKPYVLEFDQQLIFSKATFQQADFWPYAIRLAVCGQLHQLSRLFSRVLSNVPFELMGFIKELHNLTTKGIVELRTNHTYIEQVKQKLSQLQVSVHTTNIIQVLSIFTGDQQIILNHAKDDVHAFICSNYYQSSQLPIHEAANAFFKTQDQVMHRIFCGDIYGTLELCVDYDWWLITHFTDLLHLQNKLDRDVHYTIADGTTLTIGTREYFMLTYASFINNQFGLWEQAFTYLMTCGEIGREAVIEHTSRMDFHNDDTKLNQVVNFCIHYSMKNNGLVLYEKRAVVCLESKDYENAFQYYTQAEKHQYLDLVFKTMLKDFVHTGQLYDIKKIANTNNYEGVHYIICRALSEMKAFLNDGQELSAANVYSQLFCNDQIPLHLIPVVFAEGWNLLDKKSLFMLKDLLNMKKVWKRLNKQASASDFTWYHYYIHKSKAEVSENELLTDKSDCLDTTAVIVARAIDYHESKQNGE